jgi:predicted aspartyl protease
LMQQRPSSFTITANGRLRVLTTEVRISEAFDVTKSPTGQPPKPPKTYTAVWDTGASNTLVTKKVSDECGLKPTGVASVGTSKGEMRTPTYFISIGLPNRVGFPQLRVLSGEVKDADVLIGMDIIGAGDFAVTNHNGKTVFTYRFPSCECIDFVKNPPGQPANSGDKYPGTSRSALCPCGSGKSYKRCCGKKAPPKKR